LLLQLLLKVLRMWRYMVWRRLCLAAIELDHVRRRCTVTASEA